ncbi:replication initiation protein [Larsenimonas rhizosphaerae]|uniref:Replication initiation protein n=1 Tax=Larsenimonas rhizosphaerae TaxID=2944682 RepID=A0AA41ZIZ4_9GAMM|nr:replication initiation protein [Larsenimonas rhizosphaerae]MCX2525586.1 replication initiation protein [Larsenimonas rhizosphaerae]
MNKPQIYKSNALIKASYRLTPAEQRIMLACIAQVRRDKPITDEVLYDVTVADYAALVGTGSHSTYKELADAALRLKRREVWITERPNGEGSHEETLITGWVQSIRYRKNEGRIQLRFTKDMLPYLTQLTEQFTRYALSDVAKLTSSHAMRLYELLCQWRDTGHREVEIDWLRDAFQLGDKYPVLKDLKRRVIEPAVTQLNEHSPLWVKWEQRKTGRRVSHLVFTFGEKTKKIVQKTPKGKSRTGNIGKNHSTSGAMYGIPQSVIEKKAFPGESYDDAALRLLGESQHE